MEFHPATSIVRPMTDAERAGPGTEEHQQEEPEVKRVQLTLWVRDKVDGESGEADSSPPAPKDS